MSLINHHFNFPVLIPGSAVCCGEGKDFALYLTCKVDENKTFVLITPAGAAEVQGEREGYGGVDVSTVSHAG